MSPTKKKAPTSRPNRRDDAVLARAVEILRPRVEDVLEGPMDEREVDDLKQAIAYEDDVYRVCRGLDSRCWDPDDGLYHALDGVFMAKRQAYREAVEAWVKAEGITLDRSIGDRVRVEHRGQTYDGEVAESNDAMATYTVRVEALGHVPYGKLGTHGWVVDAEDVRDPQ